MGRVTRRHISATRGKGITVHLSDAQLTMLRKIDSMQKEQTQRGVVISDWHTSTIAALHARKAIETWESERREKRRRRWDGSWETTFGIPVIRAVISPHGRVLMALAEAQGRFARANEGYSGSSGASPNYCSGFR